MMRDWRHNPEKNCADEDPELFFLPEYRGPKRDAQAARAKAVCVGCPVLMQCLGFALDHNQVGVWGGTTDDERKQLLAEVAA